MNKGTRKWEKKQESREFEDRCWGFLKTFLEELHERVDRRLVKTLLDFRVRRTFIKGIGPARGFICFGG
jgi:hypothetical protein